MLLLFLYVFPLIGVGLALYKSWSDYSFWADELGSVSMALLPWREVTQSIISDVHPPLFQFVLKVWVSLTNSDESIVRLFSLVCALGALATLIVITRPIRGISQWATVTVFSTSFLFNFYAQEARSYALTLLLSTLLTGQFLKTTNKNQISYSELFAISSIAVALSLTHYFGLLFSIFTLVIISFECRKDYRKFFLISGAMVACLVWPLFHYSKGLFASKAIKNSWMIVDGPLDSLRIFLRTFFPSQSDLILLSAGMIFFGTLIWILLKNYRSSSFEKATIGMLYRCVALLLLVLVAVSVVDFISPISTERNFIVLLPIMAVLTGLMVNVIAHQRKLIITFSFLSLLVLTSINNLRFAQYLLALKWGPQQNWRETAEFVINNRTAEHLYYLRNRDDDETERVFNFYIQKLSKGTLSLERIYIGQIPNVKKPSILILGGTSPAVIKEIQKLSNTHSVRFFQPTQSLSGTTGLFIFD
jgi:hypothetical protein